MVSLHLVSFQSIELSEDSEKITSDGEEISEHNDVFTTIAIDKHHPWDNCQSIQESLASYYTGSKGKKKK